MMELLNVIAEPNRRKIMRIVWSEEKSAGDIAQAFDVTFGAVSQHLHILRESGLIEMRKAGRSRFYRARKEALGPFAKALEAMWSDALDRLKAAAEAEHPTPGLQGTRTKRNGRLKKGTANKRNPK
jgi:DNA-binding transcriptional ArsR family regulator